MAFTFTIGLSYFVPTSHAFFPAQLRLLTVDQCILFLQLYSKAHFSDSVFFLIMVYINYIGHPFLGYLNKLVYV